MTMAFGIAAAIALGAIALFGTLWYRGDHESDLGAVSHQWIAENRFGQGRGESQR